MAKKNSGKPISNKTMTFVVGVVVLLVLALLVALVPGFEESLMGWLGINNVDVTAATRIEGPTRIHMIDVGQGDATLYEQDGEFALIDAGTPESKDVLLDYLNKVGVERLRYVIMTHPHADHIGGMQAVLERFEVEKIILPDFEKAPYPTTSIFENLLAAVVEQEVPAETAQEGAVYPLGSGRFTVLQNGIATQDNYNLLSLVTVFEGGNLRIFSSGDAEKANETALVEKNLDLQAEVYIAGHHGSSTSNTEALLQRVRPAVALISCGRNNSYGHPHREPLELFEQQHAVVLRTDLQGTVVLGRNTDGDIIYAVTNAETAA